MLVTWNEYKKETYYIPQSHIILDIPRRTGDFWVSNSTYQQDLSSISQSRLDQVFDLKLSILPWDKRIFDMSPTYFLYRYTSRWNRKNNAFRTSGKKLVHPSDTSLNLIGHRYRSGKHNNPYGLLPRITEVPATISTHAISWEFEWYGGSSANPDGTLFPFTPLAWMCNSQDISNQWISFPQTLSQWNSSWAFDPMVGIEHWIVQSWAWNWQYGFRPTNNSRRNGKRAKRYYYAIQLMVKNPDFVWGSQVPEYLASSNMVHFVVDYKIVTLIDPVDSIVRKYAIDWRIRHNSAV